MKFKPLHIIIPSFLMLALVSCEKIIFSDAGEVVKKQIYYDYFSKISVYGIFDIEISTDSIYSVEIEAHEKYGELLFQTLNADTVEIRDDNQYKWLPDYPRPRLIITFPKLDDQLLIKAPVNLTTPDTLRIPRFKILSLGKVGEFDLLLDVDYFELSTGSDNYGYYSMGGIAKNCRLWPRGSSIMDASGLVTENANVYNNSVGDCRVNVSRKLVVRLNTLGNIYYSGNPPEVEILEESGSGRLIEVFE